MISIFPTLAALSAAVADRLVQIAQTAVSTRGRFLWVLSGGSTPEPLYRLLAHPPYRDQMPWRSTVAFWGDERLVPPDTAGSNYRQAADLLLRHTLIPKTHIVRMRGELSAEEAVHDYTKQLTQWTTPPRVWPRFDLVLLGLGSDGHTASLFPGPISTAETQQAVMAAAADYGDRPAPRLTLTPRVLNDARHVFFLVAGGEKREALAATRAALHQPMKWPAQRIHPDDGELHWYVDEAAASVNA